ncbi:hypothetical protein H5410_016247 [Solanum commersonii]|uniref:Uncharacterized protein n=1 Tax=Solanum commersonii TaxID=4109 RepID=A0A9J5ZX14_SOLCO|nr:hypothetical protein H5410_016247 [Solanum commersonii]
MNMPQQESSSNNGVFDMSSIDTMQGTTSSKVRHNHMTVRKNKKQYGRLVRMK